jgi:hypothetical protein
MTATQSARNGERTPPKYLKDPSKIKSVFWKILQDDLSNVMSEAPQVWSGPNSPDFRYEKALLQRCYGPFVYGLGATCLCFITFRVSGSAWFKQWRNNITQNTRPASSPVSRRTASNEKRASEWKPSSERLMEERREKINEAYSLPIDIMLSTLIGVSVSGLTLRPSRLKHDFERTPLLPGRSLISKHLCPDMTRLHNRVDPTLWEKGDSTLEALRTFVDNCRKRGEMERVIRIEQSLPDDAQVSLPKACIASDPKQLT